MTRDRRILVVEDEPLIAMDIEAELTSRGWEAVICVGTASAALKLLDTEEITAAVLDINLRGSKSFQIADVLERRNIPFLFLSGDSGESRPDDLKGRPLLSKPINYQHLHTVLDHEVNKRT